MGAFLTVVCYGVGLLAAAASAILLLDRNLQFAALLFGSAVGTLAIGYICDSLRVLRIALRADRPHAEGMPQRAATDDYLDGGRP